MRRGTIPVLLAAALAVLLAGPARRCEAAQPASLAVDAASGAVLVAEAATQRWYPASLTKLMTLYLTFAAIEAGRLRLDERLTVSAHAAAQPPTALGLRAGETIAVESAILAVITQSANDAAMLLAERVGGGEAAFVGAMNRQAQALGLKQTLFGNPTGLPNPMQTTSARDMALLALALLHDFPQHYHFFAARQVQFRRTSLPTINGILVSYRGADGLKTGFTCDSGYNLVASATRDGRRVIGVLLGATDRNSRRALMAGLLDRGFAVPPGGPHRQLAALEPLPGDPPPPHQLGARSCEASPASMAPKVTLSGWGLVLGAYQNETEARRVLAQARASLNSAGRAAQPVALPRQGSRQWSALLVGLDERQAGAACLLLRARGAYCLKLTPDALNNPEAVWR
ncbi:MAG: D-alanyl-D-alanine carboxypeptidase family protein [Dongiaceae bacterium]